MSELELKILSKFTDSREIREAWDLGLREQVFTNPQYKGIFMWVIGYWDEGQRMVAPTIEVLNDQFPGVSFENDPSELMSYLVGEVQRRHIASQAQALMVDAANGIFKDPIEALNTLWHKSYQLTESVHPRIGRSDMSNVAERRERYLRKVERGPQGLTLGLPELDEITGGILPGEICALSARPGVGKSFYLVKILVEALRQGHRPIIFTLEQRVQEMEDRIDAFWSGVSYDRLFKGHLEREEASRLMAAQDQMVNDGLPLVERPPRGDRGVKDFVTRARQIGANYVLIDQLSFIDSQEKHDDLKSKHGEIMYELKDEASSDVAGALPCVFAVQQNRQAMEKQHGRGELHHLANSDDIGQACDIVLGLSRTSEERANMSMKLDILKSRKSDEKSFLLAWHLQNRSEISFREEIEGR